MARWVLNLAFVVLLVWMVGMLSDADDSVPVKLRGRLSEVSEVAEQLEMDGLLSRAKQRLQQVDLMEILDNVVPASRRWGSHGAER